MALCPMLASLIGITWGQIRDQGPALPGAAGASSDKLLPSSGGTKPNHRCRERGETKAAGIGMRWMWGPSVMEPRDAGMGMPGQEMGQRGKKGANPIISAPSKHSRLENKTPAIPLPKYMPLHSWLWLVWGEPLPWSLPVGEQQRSAPTRRGGTSLQPPQRRQPYGFIPF